MPLKHVAAGLVLAATLSPVYGCAFFESRSKPHAEQHAIGALGAGFVDPRKPPAPEATIRPKPGSWEAVHPPRGYRVVLLTAGDDPATTTLVTAVKHWARTEHVRLTTIVTTQPTAVDGIIEAMELRPDLILCAGHALVDALALVTASHLDQQFLVVGAQLPEPTVNVTAAIWRGAATAFTPQRASAAIRAGVASVLNHISGIVISLD